MSEAPKQQLKPQQVAQFCGVTMDTVEKWLKNGRLNAAFEGTDYWVATADLLNFMHQNHLAIPAELMHSEPSNKLTAAKRVLVVDEDRPMAMNIERVLRNMGLDVLQANNGFDASVTYIQRKPQLMTLDLSLEGMDGVELIENIRATQNHKSKILVITDSMPSLINKARQAGADAILSKPFDNDALRRNVRILLDMDS